MPQFRLTVALAAVLAIAPSGAWAQVTTFVPPRAPQADSATVAARVTDSLAVRDSTAKAQVANMKAWVDSAAGDVVTVRSDSAGLTANGTAESFRNGSRAPETASPLPLLALSGASAMGVGLLLRRRQRRQRARA